MQFGFASSVWLELLFKYKVCSSGKSHCTTQELDLLSGTLAPESWVHVHACCSNMSGCSAGSGAHWNEVLVTSSILSYTHSSRWSMNEWMHTCLVPWNMCKSCVKSTAQISHSRQTFSCFQTFVECYPWAEVTFITLYPSQSILLTILLSPFYRWAEGFLCSTSASSNCYAPCWVMQ